MISYSIENDKKFQAALARAKAVTSDLRVPLNMIAKDFYRSQKAIWQLKGPGQYPDLAQFTKDKRIRELQPFYPILKRSGELQEAASTPGARGNVTRIYDNRVLTVGVEAAMVPYAIFHQSDKPRTKIPQRKFMFIGPEAKRFANSDQVGRLERWLNYLNYHVLQTLKKQGFDVGEIVQPRRGS
jgi:phage gpG-like protein